MFHVPLATSLNEVSVDQFWNSTLLYFDRPHLVNRRVTGALTALFLRVDFNNNSIKRLNEIFTRTVILYEVRKLPTISKDSIKEDFVRNIVETYDKEVILQQTDIDSFKKSKEDTFVSVRILLSRRPQEVENCIELVILDKKNKIANFHAVTEFDKKTLAPPFPYDVEYTSAGNLRICLQDLENAESSSAEWLCDQLFEKLIRWTEYSVDGSNIQQSLSLVAIETYSELYHTLKIKYGKKIVESWQEHTDPLKFVYEDIAIAAYLISLWDQTHPNQKPSFVDMGCGNGLLVYILNEEGYPGFGIDVRKRKIWDWYPKTVTLKVQIFTPSNRSLFPEADWIIGNHSDELTPWIPVIAARSSYKTNFFLLPCCAYNFSGQKYKRFNTAMGIYSEYLMFIEEVCNKAGFVTQKDKLRIPSTKRVCFVGFGRSYEQHEFVTINECIKSMISTNCNIKECDQNDLQWINTFQPRSNTEKVRNCTKLDKHLIERIVSKMCKKLLGSKHFTSKTDGTLWNMGESILIPNLIAFIGSEDLKKLKNECGGLKTIVKNHRYIFEMLNNSAVKLRIPSTADATYGKYKSKPCWFYNNHPDGCLHDNQTCAYKH